MIASADDVAATKESYTGQYLRELLIVGLFLIFSGYPEADPIAGISSIGLLVSMILFGIIALPTLRGRG